MINELIVSLALQLKQHSMHLPDSFESGQVPVSLLVRAGTQLTVDLSTFLSLLLDPCRGLSYDILYGPLLANVYLGTVGEEGTGWNDMIRHITVLSCRSTNSVKVRSETREGNADSAQVARKTRSF
jgi:hypothetical protein